MFQIFQRLRDWLSWIVLIGVAGAIVYWGFFYSTDVWTIRVAVSSHEPWHQEFGAALKLNVERGTEYRVQLLRTDGPNDSRARLLDGDADIAVLRPGTVTMDNLVALAPLWTEYSQLLVRADAEIENIGDLRGHPVALGPENTGNRLIARDLLEYYGVPVAELEHTSSGLSDFLDESGLGAAVVTRALHDPELRAALATGEFELLPVPMAGGVAFNSRYFEVGQIPAGVFPTESLPVPREALDTVAVEAVMMARPDLPAATVTALLQIMTTPGMHAGIPDLLVGDIEESQTWARLPHHAAADEFLASPGQQSVTDRLFGQAAEYAGWIISLVVVLALAGLLGLRQRRDGREGRADGSKRELERLFQEAFRVEEAQREARDVRVLQQYLTEVGQLKSRALKASLGTPLAESELFLAFIQQTRAVSQQIEWRLSAAGASRAGNEGARAGAAREAEANQ